MKGDSILRMVPQSTPAKKMWFLISSAEFLPSLVSCPTIILRAWEEQVSNLSLALLGRRTHLLIKSSLSLLSLTSSGKYN